MKKLHTKTSANISHPSHSNNTQHQTRPRYSLSLTHFSLRPDKTHPSPPHTTSQKPVPCPYSTPWSKTRTSTSCKSQNTASATHAHSAPRQLYPAPQHRISDQAYTPLEPDVWPSESVFEARGEFTFEHGNKGGELFRGGD